MVLGWEGVQALDSGLLIITIIISIIALAVEAFTMIHFPQNLPSPLHF